MCLGFRVGFLHLLYRGLSLSSIGQGFIFANRISAELLVSGLLGFGACGSKPEPLQLMQGPMPEFRALDQLSSDGSMKTLNPKP